MFIILKDKALKADNIEAFQIWPIEEVETEDGYKTIKDGFNYKLVCFMKVLPKAHFLIDTFKTFEEAHKQMEILAEQIGGT